MKIACFKSHPDFPGTSELILLNVQKNKTLAIYLFLINHFKNKLLNAFLLIKLSSKWQRRFFIIYRLFNTTTWLNTAVHCGMWRNLVVAACCVCCIVGRCACLAEYMELSTLWEVGPPIEPPDIYCTLPRQMRSHGGVARRPLSMSGV